MSPLFWLLCLQCCTLTVLSVELFNPRAIKVSDGDLLQIKTTYLERKIYNENGTELMVDMTGRAFCVNDICSIPGPTLIVYPGITFNIALSNEFIVDVVDYNDNSGPDIINIHSHGLHISGTQDNVFDAVYPSQNRLITWTIHPQHHIGTNWYHPHHHRSTGIQVSTGMYGALIVDKLENKDLDYNQPNIVKDYVVELSWQLLYDKDYCDDCRARKKYYFDDFKMLASSCYQWCDNFSQKQRDKSGYHYDININNQNTLEAFFVNNQYQPTISQLKSNQYFKLRFLSTSSALYTQLQFDYNPRTNCTYLLIARDGVALQDEMRDLSEFPYLGYFLLPAGGRIDVLILCTGSGIAEIKHCDKHPSYRDIDDLYPMGQIGSQILLKLDIEAEQSTVSVPDIDEHLKYPEPINGFPYYIQELIDTQGTDNGVEKICKCSNYDRDRTEDIFVKNTDQCALELIEGRSNAFGNGLLDLFEVNGVTFDADNPMALFLLSLNKIYEFYINSDGHPFHIHVNPFMVQRNLLDGYVAKQYDIMDTLGYNYKLGDQESFQNDPDNVGFHIRYNARDFVGNVIFHCHFLDHEDLGMMGWLKIIDETSDDSFAVCDYCANADNIFANTNQFATVHTDDNHGDYLGFTKIVNDFDDKYDKFIGNQYYHFSLVMILLISVVINIFLISMYCCCNKIQSRYYEKVSVLDNNEIDVEKENN